MQIIGMLDSPYVRRLAITMQLLGIPYEHLSLSVFSTYDKFREINPVVKVPTLICDDGMVMMDSGLIIDYLESQSGKSLMPKATDERRKVLQLLGLALAACEKAVQIVYERKRAVDKQDAAWTARLREQLLGACDALERLLSQRALACESANIDQAGVTIAVTWRFIQLMIPDVVPVSSYPALTAHCALAEQLPEFIAAPLP